MIAFANPGGHKTPQGTTHPTPDNRCIEHIQDSLNEAEIQRKRSALRDLVLMRDGPKCLLTEYPFCGPGRVPVECAHIIPSSVRDKTITVAAIEAFTGKMLAAVSIKDCINTPKNALNLEANAHTTMRCNLSWGIEARCVEDSKWKYFYRTVRPDDVAGTIKLHDGDEISFGQGNPTIDLPDPCICNVHLAVARVSHACGASEIFNECVDGGEDEERMVPVYFGGPYMGDDMLMRILEARLDT